MTRALLIASLALAACGPSTHAVRTPSAPTHTITFAPVPGKARRWVELKTELGPNVGAVTSTTVLRRHSALITLERVDPNGVEVERVHFDDAATDVAIVEQHTPFDDGLAGKTFTVEHGLDGVHARDTDGHSAAADDEMAITSHFCGFVPAHALVRYLASRTWSLGDNIDVIGDEFARFADAACAIEPASLSVRLVHIDDDLATFAFRFTGKPFDGPSVAYLAHSGFGMVRVSPHTGELETFSLTSLSSGVREGHDMRMVDFSVARYAREPEPTAP